MKKISIKGLDETVLFKELDNGLKVYMIAKPYFAYTSAIFSVPFGGMYSEYKLKNETKYIKVPKGVAHLLEHCKFEQDKRESPRQFYPRTGTFSNAITSPTNTEYFIYGYENMEENILFLLDYVQDPVFSEVNIEREKKVINEELDLMVADSIQRQSFVHMLNSTLVKSTYKNDVGGTNEEIALIDRDLLNKLYNDFYHPKNMSLVIVGNIDPDQLIKKISDNQSTKQFPEFKEPTIKEANEPYQVLTKYSESELAIEEPRIIFNLKIKRDNTDVNKMTKEDYYMAFLLNLLPGKLNEVLKQKQIAQHGANIYHFAHDNFHILSLYADASLTEEFVLEVKNYLANLCISEEEIERKKKATMRNLISRADRIDALSSYVINNLNDYGMVDINEYDIIKSINKESLQKVIDKIDLDNYSVCVIKPIKK